MQQQQIDLGKAQLGQALPGRSLEIIRREMGGPDLGRDEHIVASHSRSAQALANLAFVLIDLRGVDVAIAEPQRLLDQTCAGSPPQLPGAEPDRGNFGAVGLDELHFGNSDKPNSHYVPPALRCQHCRDEFRAQVADTPGARAANTVSGAWEITARSARAGPRGMRLPCSQFLMVSPGTPSRAANSSCVRRARRRRSRTAGTIAISGATEVVAGAMEVVAGATEVVAGATEVVAGAATGDAGASGNSCPSRNSTIRPSAFSRRRCMLDSRAAMVGDAR